MAQNELDSFEGKSAIHSPQNPNNIMIAEDIPSDYGDKLETAEPLVTIEHQLRSEERIPDIELITPHKGRDTLYISRICKDFHVLSNPKQTVRKENIRKQFIRGFRTAVEEAITHLITHRKNLHSFSPLDQYREAKWKELQMVIYENPDLEILIKKKRQREIGEFVSFENTFCKAVFEMKGAVQAFKVYVQLVFGLCEGGLEKRLRIGVRVQTEYEKKGYWERLKDYISTTMISDLQQVPTS
jgi:hypothetical protein